MPHYNISFEEQNEYFQPINSDSTAYVLHGTSSRGRDVNKPRIYSASNAI